MRNTLFSDGEGPIVHKDLAFDLTSKIGFTGPSGQVSGDKFFSALSLYDDHLAELGTEGYQAGDTLALLAPHLMHHGVTDTDVAQEASTATVINGVEGNVIGMARKNWGFRIISTSYRPMWNVIGRRLRIPPEHIACTELDLGSLAQNNYDREFAAHVEAAEQDLLPYLGMVAEAQAEIDNGAPITEVLGDDSRYAVIRKPFDQLYWRELPKLGYQALEAVKVMGGSRKVEAAESFAADLGVSMDEVAYAGDSITDDKIHEYLLAQGGLPVAVNGNAYALRNAFAGVATTDMRMFMYMLKAWSKEGRQGVTNFVAAMAPTGTTRDSIVRYHLLDGASPEQREVALADHKHFRAAVRGAVTATLG